MPPSIVPDEFTDDHAVERGNLHAMGFVGRGASGEDRIAGEIREREGACDVPQGLYAETAGTGGGAGGAVCPSENGGAAWSELARTRVRRSWSCARKRVLQVAERRGERRAKSVRA